MIIKRRVGDSVAGHLREFRCRVAVLCSRSFMVVPGGLVGHCRSAYSLLQLKGAAEFLNLAVALYRLPMFGDQCLQAFECSADLVIE